MWLRWIPDFSANSSRLQNAQAIRDELVQRPGPQVVGKLDAEDLDRTRMVSHGLPVNND
jgi:hypothetical protein